MLWANGPVFMKISRVSLELHMSAVSAHSLYDEQLKAGLSTHRNNGSTPDGSSGVDKLQVAALVWI